MRIDTRYSVGDIVWFIRHNKVNSAKISSVSVSFGESAKLSEIYTGRKIENSVTWLDFNNLHGESLFPTKKSLLDSI